MFTLETTDFPTDAGPAPIPGLGLNIVRYNAGACGWNQIDNVSMVTLANRKPSREMEGFWMDNASDDPSSSSWDWAVDANQRKMLLMARDRGSDIFELFSNSPMWWMLRNRNPSGGAGFGEENLLPGHEALHAKYLATVAEYAENNWNITFRSISPFNEPSLLAWAEDFEYNTQEGCNFNASSQTAVIKGLRQELQERGLGTAIHASDENTIDQAFESWTAVPDRYRILVDGVNVHGYRDEQGAGADRASALYKDAYRHYGKSLWLSEYGGDDTDGLTTARHLLSDLDRLRPSAWVYWQVLDQGGWGLIRADIDNRTVEGVSPKHFVLAQFTRHIRPGMIMLDGGGTETAAAYDEEGKKLVIVALNGKPTPRTLRLDITGFHFGPGEAFDAMDMEHSVDIWTTNNAERYQRASLHMRDMKLVVPMSENEVVTMEVKGLYLDETIRAQEEYRVSSWAPKRVLDPEMDEVWPWWYNNIPMGTPEDSPT